jgi:hypothetical protein
LFTKRPLYNWQIVNIINCDVPNTVIGILTLVFLGDPQVKGYYHGGQQVM